MRYPGALVAAGIPRVPYTLAAGVLPAHIQVHSRGALVCPEARVGSMARGEARKRTKAKTDLRTEKPPKRWIQRFISTRSCEETTAMAKGAKPARLLRIQFQTDSLEQKGPRQSQNPMTWPESASMELSGRTWWSSARCPKWRLR